MDTPAASSVEWLNRQFESPEARENSENFAAKLLVSLQHQMYKAQQGMDDVSQQLLTSRSSFSHDIPAIRTHANYLVNDLSDLHTRLEGTSGVANQSIEKIRATEMVKQRMELTYRSLENQDNWEALLGNIQELIASGDLEAISGRLSALQKCLVSLSDAVDHEGRRGQLEEVKNSVESVLIPRLISSLAAVVPWKSTTGGRNATGSEGVVLKMVHIFDLLHRTETLKRILNDCRQRQFLARWDELLTSLQDEAGNVSFEECIGNFYEEMSSSWHTQLPLLAAAYSDPANALLHSYMSILLEVGQKISQQIDVLRRKLSDCAASDCAASSEDFLSSLLTVKRSQEAFCLSMMKEYHHSRHPAAVDLTNDFTSAVRRPFESAVEACYVQVEMKILTVELKRLQLNTVEKEKSLHVLLGSATRFGSVLYSAVLRCFQLTDGRLLKELVTAVNVCVTDQTKKVQDFAGQLKTGQLEASGRLSDFTEADCDTLNSLIKVLQHSGDLVLQLENIDHMLIQDKIHPDPADQRVFASSIIVVEDMANTVFQWTLGLLLRPVEVLLEGVPGLSSWTTSTTKSGLTDIPSFGLDPQEYITRIGNYLLTLPQIMDPVLSSESPSMKRLKNVLRFPAIAVPDDSTSLTEAWIQATVYEAMLIVTAVLTKTRHLTSLGIRHMMADLRYFQNVVEDFAVPLSETFVALSDLLTCSPNDWMAKIEAAPPVIVNFVKRARNFD